MSCKLLGSVFIISYVLGAVLVSSVMFLLMSFSLAFPVLDIGLLGPHLLDVSSFFHVLDFHWTA